MNHPKPAETSRSAYTSKFFGPKLQSSGGGGGDNQQQPRQVVRKIDNQVYDYGVPQSQAHPSSSQTTKLLDKKQQKYLEKIGRNMYGESTQKSSSSKVTADIYVFARKRPKLECEANFNDVISVDRVVRDHDHHYRGQFDSSSSSSTSSLSDDTSLTQSQRRLGSICVHECKSSVDGTPILRKVRISLNPTILVTDYPILTRVFHIC